MIVEASVLSPFKEPRITNLIKTKPNLADCTHILPMSVYAENMFTRCIEIYKLLLIRIQQRWPHIL